VHITRDSQAKYLFSYIHLNPLKLINPGWKEKGIKNKKEALQFLSEYRWGSYLDYLGTLRLENKIIDRINFLDYFESRDLFQEEIFDWIKIDSDISE
jgi:hypothetical protein